MKTRSACCLLAVVTSLVVLATASTASAAMIDATNSGAPWSVNPGSSISIDVFITPGGSDPLATAANLVFEVRPVGAAVPDAGGPTISSVVWLTSGYVFNGFSSMGSFLPPPPQSFQEGAFKIGTGATLNGKLATITIQTAAAHAGQLFDISIGTENSTLASVNRVTDFRASDDTVIAYTPTYPLGVAGQFQVVPEPIALAQLLALVGACGAVGVVRVLRRNRPRGA